VGPRRPGRRAILPSPVHVQNPALRRPQAVVSDRPQRQLAAGCAEKICPSSSRLGRLDAGQYVRRPLHHRRRKERSHRAHGHRVHDGAGRVVHHHHGRNAAGLLPDCGRNCGRLPHLCGPMLHQDLQREHVPLWAYFCQISDSTTSYGSYSGAVPNEKITWGKLGEKTPKFIIESTLPSSRRCCLPTFWLVEQAFTCLDLHDDRDVCIKRPVASTGILMRCRESKSEILAPRSYQVKLKLYYVVAICLAASIVTPAFAQSAERIPTSKVCHVPRRGRPWRHTGRQGHEGCVFKDPAVVKTRTLRGSSSSRAARQDAGLRRQADGRSDHGSGGVHPHTGEVGRKRTRPDKAQGKCIGPVRENGMHHSCFQEAFLTVQEAGAP